MWTAAVHVPLGIAVAAAVWPRGGLIVATVLIVSICAAPTLALTPIVSPAYPDRPRPRWRVDGFERPFYAHWAAAHFALPGWVAGLAVGLFFPGALGQAWWGALATYAIALASFLWGAFVTPSRLRVRRHTVVVRELPAAFDGYCIAHLSDLHVGGFTRTSTVRRWVRTVAREAPDLTAITGDLVTSGIAFHRAIAQHLGDLAGADGVVFVPGNHDYFGDGQPLFGELQNRGLRVLRNEHFVVERGGQRLIVAGADDDWTGRTDLERALLGRPDGVTILLVHNPAWFDRAAGSGVSLVLAGHTHGGQIAVPGFARWLNLTRLSHRYSLGLYRRGGSVLVVSGGLGCTGLPLRTGVVPEVRVIRLVRAEPPHPVSTRVPWRT